MSLVEAPLNLPFRIAVNRSGDRRTRDRYAAAGMSVGRHARVLARYPVSKPRFVEVELDGSHLVTLPYDVATGFLIEPVIEASSVR